MPKIHKLQDIYRFPGFRPGAKLRGVYGDPYARLVTLRRYGKKMICGECGAVNHAIYDRKLHQVRDVPCGDIRIYLEVEIRRVKCCKCGNVRQEKLEWLSDNPAYTKRFAFFYGPEMPGGDDNLGSQRDEAGLEDH